MYKDQMIIIGGLGAGGETDLLSETLVFTPAKNEWRHLPDFPTQVFAPGAGVLGTTLFVFGGLRVDEMTQDHWPYSKVICSLDLENQEKGWQTATKTMSEGKAFVQVVSLDSQRLGLLGGHGGDGATDNNSPVSTFFRSFRSFQQRQSKSSRSQPSCPSVWATPGVCRTRESPDPMGSGSDSDAVNAS